MKIESYLYFKVQFLYEIEQKIIIRNSSHKIKRIKIQVILCKKSIKGYYHDHYKNKFFVNPFIIEKKNDHSNSIKR